MDFSENGSERNDSNGSLISTSSLSDLRYSSGKGRRPIAAKFDSPYTGRNNYTMNERFIEDFYRNNTDWQRWIWPCFQSKNTEIDREDLMLLNVLNTIQKIKKR
uniref:Uncharacterized protein n=1 Tax=Ixodes ricinus TaxID=34613 RepID=A0A0K8RL03_IXORI